MKERGDIRIGMIGTGQMARVRTGAFRDAGADVVAVLGRDPARTSRFAAEQRIPVAHTRPDDFFDAGLDAVVLEVPHVVQDELCEAALRRGLHVLVGGPLAGTVGHGERLVGLAAAGGLVLETGYEARYAQVWEAARRWISDGAGGPVVAVSATALFPQNPDAWYSDQRLSGGMPVTHLTYCFLNPLRWVLGDPDVAGAVANRIVNTSARAVDQETVACCLRFPGGIVGTLLGGYVAPPHLPAWQVTFVGRDGALEIRPGDNSPSSATWHGPDGVTHRRFDDRPFARQAGTFLAAANGDGTTLAPGADALTDLRLADHIVQLTTTQE